MSQNIVNHLFSFVNLLAASKTYKIYLFGLSLFFLQNINAQGDFNFLREPADTNEIFEQSNQNLNTNPNRSRLSNSKNKKSDTLKQNTPVDTINADNDPLSINLKSDTALVSNGGGSFPAQLNSESQDGFTIEKEKKLFGAASKNKNNTFEDTILFYIFCGIIFIYALTRIWFSTYITNLFRAFQNLRTARIHYEDASFRDTIPKILLLVNAVLVFSLFVYWFVSRYFEATDNPLLLWAGCMFIFMLFFFLRFFAIKASAWMFPITETIDYYFYNVQLVNIVTAWFLTPLLMFALFVNSVPNNIIAGILLSIWGICVLIRLYRGYEIGQKALVNYPFYFFIYLCTLEISPLLVIYKFFIKI